MHWLVNLIRNYLQEEPIPGIENEYELYKRYFT